MKKKPAIKPGDLVYFNRVKSDLRKATPEIGFKGGRGFGVFLGAVPPGGVGVRGEHIMILMGSAGFMSFDDIANFLGDDAAKKCIQEFEKKYYPRVSEAIAQVPQDNSNLILPPQ